MKIAKRWVRVTQSDNIPVREGRAVKIGTREIAIFNLGGRFLAVDARCPHKRGPLAEGIVTGLTVVCPLHAWKINLETGTVVHPIANSGIAPAMDSSPNPSAGSANRETGSNASGEPPCVETFRTRVEDGVVLVEIPAGACAQQPPSLSCIPQDRPASFLY